MQNLNPMLTHAELFDKINRLDEYIIVHVKPDLTPALYECETKKLYNVPEDYMDYEKKHLWRKAA